MTPAGFPHSDIHGSLPACGSPWLFAACHVLLRRMVPWHPPCALISLIFSSLRPETNCFLLRVHSLSLVPASRNWPFRSNLLAVQLSRCKVLRALALRSGFEFPQTLKTIQSLTLQVTVSSYAAHAVSSVSALALPRFSLSSSSSRSCLEFPLGF